MARQLTLVAWKAVGVSPRWTDLAAFTVEYDTDVVLPSKKLLAPDATISLPAYTFIGRIEFVLLAAPPLEARQS